jgi:hypothetical protein
MSYDEAVSLVKYHQNMMSQVDEYTEEYIVDLLDPHSKGNGKRLSQALEIVLKGVNTDGQGKDYPRAS